MLILIYLLLTGIGVDIDVKSYIDIDVDVALDVDLDVDLDVGLDVDIDTGADVLTLMLRFMLLLV